MSDEQKEPVIQPEPARFFTPLIIVMIAIVIIGVVVIFLGKVIIGALLALLGAVFAVGSQVGRNTKL